VLLGIEDKLKSKPRELSGGQRQQSLAKRSCENRRCSCSTSHSPTWTPSYGSRCERSWSSYTTNLGLLQSTFQQPNRGDDARGKDRSDAGWGDPPVRFSATDVRSSRGPVCGGVHWQPRSKEPRSKLRGIKRQKAKPIHLSGVDPHVAV